MDKAYIVANEQQEREVLEKLEQEGMTWISGSKPIERIPSNGSFIEFPYVLLGDGKVSWCEIYQLEDEEIVFDGRKEHQMSEKYVVSQNFMDKLEEWRDDIRHEWFYKKDDGKWLNSSDISDLEGIAEDWWLDTEISDNESNNRLIAIIRWVNGEDVFEVEKPKKWVVRSKGTDSNGKYHYSILSHFSDLPSMDYYFVYEEDDATRFNTKEEAESWANAHQEVVEVEQ